MSLRDAIEPGGGGAGPDNRGDASTGQVLGAFHPVRVLHRRRSLRQPEHNGSFWAPDGPQVGARVWLLDAPDSLLVQSHRNADGSGLGFFGADGAPVLDKQPEPAFADPEFRRQAKTAVSETFVAHVRFATAGGRMVQNTHPFVMRGRMMAHNGAGYPCPARPWTPKELADASRQEHGSRVSG
jgi:hypothetical protein